MNSRPKAEPQDCPRSELLRRVSRGAAPPDEEAFVEQHLNTCTACRRRFDELLEGAAAAAELRDAWQGASEADWEAIRMAGVPPFPRAEVHPSGVVLPDGLHLPLPTRQGCLARLGQYDVTSILGVGGMGTVLRARDERLRREVALKVIGSRWLHDATVRQRFLDEARAAAGLKHPHIATIHAVEEESEVPFIVMEYVRGKSLSLIIAEKGQLPPVEAARITRQLLDALAHAHRQGIIHRDIKPDNVLLEQEDGVVKLVDFGLAWGVADAVRRTDEGSVVGTPWYMSPEQISGVHHPDPRTDLFSVGVMLFEMLGGVLPFPGKDVHHVMKQIRAEDIPELREIDPDIPTELAEITQRALTKEAASRFQSADEFAQAITGYLEGQTAAAKPTASAAPYIRCSSCSGAIASQLSVAGTCETCGTPLCSTCWQVRGIRRCSRHAEPESPTEESQPNGSTSRPRSLRGEARPIRRREYKVEESGEAYQRPREFPPAAAPPAAVAASQAAPHSPEEAQPVATPRAAEVTEKIARARAAGRPAVSAADARLAEETFLRLVENCLPDVHEVFDPRRGYPITVNNWSKLVRRSSRLDDEKPTDDVPRPWADDGPRGASLVIDVRKRQWLGGLKGRIVMEARSLAHMERFATEGYDDQPMTRAELESLLNKIARRATDSATWHAVILHSPTGWTDEARQFAMGKGPRPFHDRLTSVVLFDAASAGFLMDEKDEKLLSLRDAFEAGMDEDTFVRARQFIENYFQLHNSLSVETLLRELEISRKAAVRAFKVLSATGAYDLNTLDEVGMVLIRQQ